MKKTRILYWIFTGLFAAFMLFSAVPDVLSTQEAVTFMTNLGYPLYFIPFIGVAKILGVIAILIPGFPRITEWAYAGLAFDLIGATYSIISIGEPFTSWIFMLIPMILMVCSYVFYHKKLKASSLKRAA
jgi:uncharacterized membrane protein YphA (DoxX/SURF4 family)